MGAIVFKININSTISKHTKKVSEFELKTFMENLIDKDGEKKTVIIGLSGGPSSFIAAYLLKIQKYDLIGVTILQKSNSDTKCFISEDALKKIKDFCLRLNIPHHTVEADEEYIEKVQNTWVSKKIEALP